MAMKSLQFIAVLAFLAAPLGAQVPFAPPIHNPENKYLCWHDYRIEINQYGGLGRNWPAPELVRAQFDRLAETAARNPEPPNTLRAVLLVIPNTHATAVKRTGDQETVVGTKTTSMTSDEIRWALEQWRQVEDMIYVYSQGNAWLRTDIRIIDEPLRVKTDEDWVFWSGQQRALLDKYLPFDRGDYQSYNAIYNAKGLRASPHGGTIGAVAGIKGCGTSDNAFYGRERLGHRTGYVCLHEWLNQQASATSNIMPYPDDESLWNNYILQQIGYREDKSLDAWPWLTARRDTMMHVIRPGMWRRWSALDPYHAPPIGRWVMFGPTRDADARTISTAPAADGRLAEINLSRYDAFNIMDIQGDDNRSWGSGTYWFRTYVEAGEEQEVRLWAGADERFRLWLNGVLVRDAWGWNYFEDDGQLVEKVTYLTLQRGVNTLILELPNDNHKVEFRARLCDFDGSGHPPAGVTTMPLLGDKQPLPLATPTQHDFREPRRYAWDDVQDQPWLKLPRFGEAELRALTGITDLAVRTTGPLQRDDAGRAFHPPQHVFLDVPADAVTSPHLAAPAENNARLNNDLDYNWKSLAWLRVPGRPGPAKDVVLLRFDVAEPLLHLLKTAGPPANECLVGWYLFEHKLGYVVLTDLDVAPPPATPLGLLTRKPQVDPPLKTSGTKDRPTAASPPAR